MQPDIKPLVPVRSLRLAAGVSLEWPGKRHGTGSITSSPPTTSEFWSIGYDARARHHAVAYFAPGPDLGRAPAEVLMVPESWAVWVPA